MRAEEPAQRGAGPAVGGAAGARVPLRALGSGRRAADHGSRRGPLRSGSSIDVRSRRSTATPYHRPSSGLPLLPMSWNAADSCRRRAVAAGRTRTDRRSRPAWSRRLVWRPARRTPRTRRGTRRRPHTHAPSTSVLRVRHGRSAASTRPARSSVICTSTQTIASASGRPRRRAAACSRRCSGRARHSDGSLGRELSSAPTRSRRRTRTAASAARARRELESGIRRSSSSNITRISRRASDAPRQKCVPKPNATWWLCSRATSNVSGSSKTRSSRFADAVHQQDLVARRDRLAVQLVVLGRGAAHVEDRRDPPDELFDARPAEDARVVDERRALVGMAGELEAHRADDGARGLGAAVEQQQRLVHDLVVVHRPARCRRGARPRSGPTPRTGRRGDRLVARRRHRAPRSRTRAPR